MTVWDNANSKIVDTTTLYRQGVCDLVKNHLYRLISSYTTGRAITPADYSYILETKTIPYGLERHDVSAQIAEASESYAADLLDRVYDWVSTLNLFRPVDEIVLFGGGANLLGSCEKINGTVLDSPEFANARGFMESLS